MKKRILKAAAFVAALALIAGVCIFANALVGNPISKAMAKNAAKDHIEKNYSDKDFKIESVTFNFKDGNYCALITSPNSTDSNFTLQIDMWGKLCEDNYEHRVLTGQNTAERIDRDYRNKVDAILNSQSFPYNERIGYGEIEFISREYKNDPSVPDYAIVTEDLTLDAFYDANEFGAKAGKLTVCIDNDTVSIERLSEMILDVRRIFDDAGVKFYTIDFALEYPANSDGSKKEGRVEVMDFLYTDIYEEGMIERVRASNESANVYYSQQNAKKIIDIEKSK